MREIVSFGDHLGADENVDLTTRQTGQNILIGMPSPGRITVHAGDARLREDTPDLALDLLGARAKILHPCPSAGGAALGGRGGELAVVTFQCAIIDVEG